MTVVLIAPIGLFLLFIYLGDATNYADKGSGKERGELTHQSEDVPGSIMCR